MTKTNVLNRWTLCVVGAVLATFTLSTWAAEDSDCPVEVPFHEEWSGSGHADAEAEAFVHWDEDDPPQVPTGCAKCHSSPGHLDFLGADGTPAGVVDNPSPIGTTVTCVTCHNEAAAHLDTVVFPSGAEITDMGSEARCMNCHQGRASKLSVDDRIAGAGVTDDDEVSSGLGFVNIHYYAAAATRWGTMVKGGYEYDGKTYDAKFAHVEGADTCITCHNEHSLEIRMDKCVTCHEEVAVEDDLKDIRLFGSTSDYDGDGDYVEGIYYEIEGLRDILYSTMQAYATAGGNPIVYDAGSYPYFFNDTNGNGVADEGEATRSNGYSSWTARLLKAAYNFQVVLKDPGGFAHGGKYLIQLMYDSIEDLDPAAVANLARIDAGHFAGSEEAWRHWDEDGEVSASCSKCHSSKGLPFYVAEGTTASMPLSNGMLCTTCHSSVPGFERHVVNEVEFPSGAVVSFGEGEDSNICISCHQGRESAVSVNTAIAGLDPDTVASSLRFRNVHYFAAGATLFGDNAKGGYEYPGMSYSGRFDHTSSYDTCTECHDSHELTIRVHDCARCHKGIASAHDIRRDKTDFDGDGNTSEGLYHEVGTVHKHLYLAIQHYAATRIGKPIIWADGYPYWFNDTNGNGEEDPGEATRSNGFGSWTPRLLQAAYNYQYVKKDPGAFSHNGKYVLQLMIDSLVSVGGDAGGMTRPEAEGSSAVCGDATHPYPQGDYNRDCVVDWADAAVFFDGWLTNSNP